MANRSLSQAAYDRLESCIVTTELTPGTRTTLTALESMAGFGRTPVLDAVKRLSAAGLILVQPRSGLRIAPLDLRQELLLLPVRVEMEAIACRLAARRASGSTKTRLAAAAEQLRSNGATMTLTEFNLVDLDLNTAILIASGETILGSTLAPLQTLYRRSGWIFQVERGDKAILQRTAARHLELLDLILAEDAEGAERSVRNMLSGVSLYLNKMLEKARS